MKKLDLAPEETMCLPLGKCPCGEQLSGILDVPEMYYGAERPKPCTGCGKLHYYRTFPKGSGGQRTRRYPAEKSHWMFQLLRWGLWDYQAEHGLPTTLARLWCRWVPVEPRHVGYAAVFVGSVIHMAFFPWGVLNVCVLAWFCTSWGLLAESEKGPWGWAAEDARGQLRFYRAWWGLPILVFTALVDWRSALGWWVLWMGLYWVPLRRGESTTEILMSHSKEVE